LFKLFAFTENEKERYFAQTSSIDECVSSAENWAHNREQISEFLDDFDKDQGIKVCIVSCMLSCRYLLKVRNFSTCPIPMLENSSTRKHNYTMTEHFFKR